VETAPISLSGCSTTPPEVRPFARSADEAFAEELFDGVWRLILPLPYSPRGTVNCYLLEGAEGHCLVDCGTSLAPGWDALEQALAKAYTEPRSISLLVCTHAHPDHYGLAATTKERAGCALALAPGPLAVADVLRDPAVPVERRRELVRRAGVPPETLAAALLPPGDDCHHERPLPDVRLQEGDTIPSRSGAWRVVPAPGHAPTQLVLLHERTRVLICADLTVTLRIPYLEYGHSADPWAEQIASLARCRNLDATLLLPGHGRPLAEPDQALAGAVACFETAPGLILDSIVDGPLSAYEVVLEVSGEDAPFYTRHMSLAGALCVLERLEDSGECVAVDGKDGIRRFRALQSTGGSLRAS